MRAAITHLLSAALLLLWALPAAGQATVYRCTGAGGVVSFQQAPCANGAGGAIEVPPTNVVQSDALAVQRYATELQRGAAVRQAIARGAIVQGMTADELAQVMGQPRAVNSTLVGGQLEHQLVYHRGDGVQRYVYLRDGQVVAAQIFETGGRHRHRSP